MSQIENSENSENSENLDDIEDSGFVEFIDPEDLGKPRIHLCGRFRYSRKHDRHVETFKTWMGPVTVGMWLGGKYKKEQQDACFVGEDGSGGLWLCVADGLGGHPGGAQASEIAVRVLEKEICSIKPEIDAYFRNTVRLNMAKDRVIMSNPKKTGGACICVVHINTVNHKLTAYSMGDVEVSVFRRGEKVILANVLDSGDSGTSKVTKVLTPSRKCDFNVGEVWLRPSDRIFVHSDGLSNKAFKGFAERDLPVSEQMHKVIEISEKENGPHADNMSIICVNRFLPRTTPLYQPDNSEEIFGSILKPEQI